MVNRYKVIYSEYAEKQLFELGRYIAEVSSIETAVNYIKGIETYCQSLNQFPYRGQQRDAIYPGLRSIGYKSGSVFSSSFSRVLLKLSASTTVDRHTKRTSKINAARLTNSTRSSV